MNKTSFAMTSKPLFLFNFMVEPSNVYMKLLFTHNQFSLFQLPIFFEYSSNSLAIKFDCKQFLWIETKIPKSKFLKHDLSSKDKRKKFEYFSY